jgi:hypothetical protein
MIPSPEQVVKVTAMVMVRFFVATFKMAGYLVVASCEIGWFIAHGRRDKIGDTIGRAGQSIVNAWAEIFTIK